MLIAKCFTRRGLIRLLLPLILAVPAGASSAAEPSSPLEIRLVPIEIEEKAFKYRLRADFRLRQELLENAFHFDALNDRRWIRLRSRAELSGGWNDQFFSLRLCNEFRKITYPDTEIDIDELIIDRLFWMASGKLRERRATLTLGRQDIKWNRGWLMLEGHPLDGSRSMYHNAARLELSGALTGKLDIALIHNPKYDPLVIARDRDRALAPVDETACAMQLVGKSGGFNSAILIWKRESDPDGKLPPREALTMAYRRHESDAAGDPGLDLFYEAAIQQHIDAGGSDPAFGFQAELRKTWQVGNELQGGLFHHSGEGTGLSGFRAPWGRWPKWSELYIYTLIPEGGVADWQNCSAFHLGLKRRLIDRRAKMPDIDLRLATYQLYASEPSWQHRGLLSQVELKLVFNHRLSAHLLWERLAPGEFHADIDGAVHFLRWQVNAGF